MQANADGGSYADWLARFEAEHGAITPIDDRRLGWIEDAVGTGISKDAVRDLVAEVRRLRDANARLENVVFVRDDDLRALIVEMRRLRDANSRLLASDQGAQSVLPGPVVRRSETKTDIPDAREARCESV